MGWRYVSLWLGDMRPNRKKTCERRDVGSIGDKKGAAHRNIGRKRLQKIGIIGYLSHGIKEIKGVGKMVVINVGEVRNLADVWKKCICDIKPIIPQKIKKLRSSET